MDKERCSILLCVHLQITSTLPLGQWGINEKLYSQMASTAPSANFSFCKQWPSSKDWLIRKLFFSHRLTNPGQQDPFISHLITKVPLLLQLKSYLSIYTIHWLFLEYWKLNLYNCIYSIVVYQRWFWTGLYPKCTENIYVQISCNV